LVLALLLLTLSNLFLGLTKATHKATEL